MGVVDVIGGGRGDGGQIVDEAFEDALSRRYLAYALSTITARALPDVRDGLKPVHRRILYAMREMRLDPGQGFKKSAKVVGEVMGNYHPHGDQAIYDAMARLAQDFAVRYPLVDGQGNFGNIDGDNPAAMRYTESRLTAAAALLLEGLGEEAVDFRPTYDGQSEEPTVLPAAFPNLLANGATGIAVGMATNIPPHNAAELIDAARLLIARPEAGIDDLLAIVRGPDLPTGGVIAADPAQLREIYETGKGGLRLRARWQIEEYERGQWRIIVEEIPFQVEKAKLITAIADLLEDKKVPLLGDVRDESAETIRLVLEPKSRNVAPEMLMESLFRLSPLETRLSINMTALDAKGAPRVMGLREILRAFLDHRRDVLLRRSSRRQRKIAERLEVLAGLLIAFLNLDEVIRIIREEDEPKPALIERFRITDVQAESILNTRLRSLRRLEEMEIKGEDAALRAELQQIEALLGSEVAQWQRISGELANTRKAFGPDTALGRRRTVITGPMEARALVADALVAREDVTILLSQKGWVRALKGHLDDLDGVKFKEGDALAFVARGETTTRLILAASDGRFYALAPDKLPTGRGFGEPLRLMVDMDDGAEAIGLFFHVPGRQRLVATSDGKGFIVAEDQLLSAKKAGKQVMNLSTGTRMILCREAAGDRVALIGENRKLLVFDRAELPEMERGQGVKLQTLRDGGLADALVFSSGTGLYWVDSAGRNRVVEDWRDFEGKRAGAGKPAPKGFSRNGRFDARPA